jgi:hypothetical protein
MAMKCTNKAAMVHGQGDRSEWGAFGDGSFEAASYVVSKGKVSPKIFQHLRYNCKGVFCSAKISK